MKVSRFANQAKANQARKAANVKIIRGNVSPVSPETRAAWKAAARRLAAKRLATAI